MTYGANSDTIPKLTMRLERLRGALLGLNEKRRPEGIKKKIDANTIDDFIAIVGKEGLNSISIYSDKIPVGLERQTTPHGRTGNYVFANYFLSSRNKDLTVKYFERYTKFFGSEDGLINSQELEKEFIRAVITAQQRIRRIQSELPTVNIEHINLATNLAFTKEELDILEERRKELRLSPYVTLVK